MLYSFFFLSFAYFTFPPNFALAFPSSLETSAETLPQ